MLRPPPTSGPYGRDFEAYYAAGAVWNAGGDPYGRAPWRVERTIPGVDASHDELLPYVGPAAALPLFGALARLPWNAAVVLWSAAMYLAAAALMLGALSLAGGFRAGLLVPAALFAAASGPVTSALALAQAATVAVAGIAFALVSYARRWTLPAFLATLVAALQPNLAIALAARMRDRFAFGGALAAGAAFAALTLFAGHGAAGAADYLRRLGEHGRAERFVTIQHTPAAIAWALGAPDAAAVAAGTAIALAAIVTVVVLTLRARLDALDGTLLALAALPFAIPFFHEHDFICEVLPLAILARRANGAARAWTGVAAAAVLVDWLGLAQRTPGQMQILAQGLALCGAFAALGEGARLRRADLAAPAALAVLALFAFPLARAHPAPTWPDALPAGYRAPALADASAVWADEQRAAGLERREPAWGALRAIPLAGCIVLGAAIVRCRRSSCRRTAPPDSGASS